MTQVDPATVKQQQHEQWSRAAAGWRKHDERLRRSSAPVTQRLLTLAGVAPGMRVLDIASGTGEPGLPAAQIAGPQGFVLLTDFAQEMLDVAHDKARAQGLTNVDFQRVDGEEVDAEPGSFGAALCRWGLMFMPEPLRCLRAAHRALRPGGRMAVAVWGPPQLNPFFTVPVGVLGKYVEVPPPDPSAPGVFAFAERSKLASVFTEAGFADVQVEDLELTMADFTTGREYAEYLTEIAGPLATMLRQVEPAKQPQVLEEIAAAAAGGDPGGAVSLNGYALLAVGTR